MVARTVNPPARLTIDIYSDVMCPWCIIGYAQLQQGLALVKDEIEAEPRWLPFELNPDLPPDGEGQSEHLARKYGRTPAEAETGRAALLTLAERAGYSLAWAGPGEAPRAMIWNTFRAHKLLKWALIEAGAATQTRLKLALFDAHFQQYRNVSDPQVLVDIAEQAGLDPTGAGAAIEDEILGRLVRREQAQAWDMNISGVPAMLIQGRYLIPGAQEPQVYATALRRVVAKGL